MILRYGRRRAQGGELFLPGAPGPHPVVVVLHGGFWQAGYGRRLMNRVSAALAGAGFAAWNLEYRRVGGGGGWPSTFLDVAAGVDAVTRLPAMDRSQVIALGHSAGAQLALWAAGRPTLPLGAPGASPEVVVTAAVSLAGVVDLVHAAERGIGGPAVAQLLGGRPAAVPDRYALASPMARLPLGLPQLLVHGQDDRHVPVGMTRRYGAAALAAGDDVDVLTPAGVNHMDLIDPRSPAWADVVGWLRDITGS